MAIAGFLPMSFYVTGGTLDPRAPSYVRRDADQQLLEALLQGEFCYVLTSRQMGKSSLMVRAANRMEALGIKVAALDLTAIGAQDLTSEQWYNGLLDLLSEAIGFSEPLEAFWQRHQNLGPLQRLMTSIRKVVLPALTREDHPQARPPALDLPDAPQPPELRPNSRVRLAIFLDEIDIVRSLRFPGDELFGAIRECYNRRARDATYEAIAFCLLGVATPTDLIRDTQRTPFNIGRRIELNDFTVEEAQALLPGLVTPETEPAQARLLLSRILHWTGGHPYLSQRLCQETANLLRNRLGSDPTVDRSMNWTNALIDELCCELFLNPHALKQDPNLSFVSEQLLRTKSDSASLLHLYQKIRNNSHVPDDELDALANELRLAGIVRSSSGRLVVRNRIYARAFDGEWVRANMPAAELRREREAFRRGLFLAAAVSFCIVAMMAGLTMLALSARNHERRESARAYVSEAGAQRMSGRAGQRLDSLTALNKAQRAYGDRSRLRQEATAALTLVDLKERPGWAADRDGVITAVSSELSVAAQVEFDHSITIFNPTTSEILSKLPKLSPKPASLEFSPSGRVLLVGHQMPFGGRLTVWDWSKGHELFPALDRVETHAVDFTRSGRELAVATDGKIRIYSIPTGLCAWEQPLHFTSGLPRVPDVVRFSPSGELLAEACDTDYTVRVWRVADHKQVGELWHPALVYDMAWGDGGRFLACACGDETIYLWKTNNFTRPYTQLRGHSDQVRQVAFSHVGNLLVSVGRDDTLRIWSVASEKQLLMDECQPMDAIRFSAKDDHLICSAGAQTTLHLLEFVAGEHWTLRTEPGKFGTRHTLDFSPDGHRLLATLSGEVIIFDLAALREIARLPVVKTHAAYFDANGHIVECADGGFFTYSLASATSVEGPAEERLDRGLVELTALALSPDRKQAAVVHRDQVLLFNLASMSLLSSNLVGQHYDRLALHPGMRWLAGKSKDSLSIDLWNLESRPRHPVLSVPSASEHFSFDPSGRWLIISEPTGFTLLQVGNWKQQSYSALQRQKHSAQPGPLAVNTSGTLLAVVSSHNLIELWRLPETMGGLKPELITVLDAQNRLESLTFSPDGVWLGAISKDTKGPLIELWNLKRLWAGLNAYL